MQLNRLVKTLDGHRIFALEDFIVKGITSNSRQVKQDFVFVAIKGTNLDGHQFINEALKNGSRAIVSEINPKDSIPPGISWVRVRDSRRALARLAAEFYGHPSEKMKVIGITGTNGKTTVSYLIESLLKAKGEESAVIGTINYRFKDKVFPAKNTTPGSLEVQSLLVDIKKEGIDYAVIEISSHALDQERVSDINFDYAIFTNLSHDHLDYHGNIEKYFLAKSKLFKYLKPDATSIINIDDSYAKKLIKLTRAKVLTYGLKRKAHLSAFDIRFSIEGMKFILFSHKGKIDIETDLMGLHNVYNILSAVSFGLSEGIKLDLIKETISKFRTPSGRLERIDVPADYFVFIDYAHTPDALKNVILTLREVSDKKIIVTFGCGGNRDREKRPKMGKITSELADFAVITSDNPRDEEPLDIIGDILKGIKKDNYKVIPERKVAIFEALTMAKSGDVVLIAGKGHENYQVLKNRTISFDDHSVVKNFFNKL